MLDGVGNDVGDMLVGKRVHRFLAMAFYPDQPGTAQHPQVLGDQRLAEAEPVNQLVDEPWLLGKLSHDRQPGRSRQYPQQLSGRLKCPRPVRHPPI